MRGGGSMCNGTGNPSRRSLLGMALAGVAGNLPQALGAAGTGNRFLVSIYLLGGSDGDSLIVPLEERRYRRYAEIRGPLALSADALLRVRAVKNPGEFGF